MSSKSATEHITYIEREINWMGVDGQLNEPEAAKLAKEVMDSVHKMRVYFENILAPESENTPLF